MLCHWAVCPQLVFMTCYSLPLFIHFLVTNWRNASYSWQPANFVTERDSFFFSNLAKTPWLKKVIEVTEGRLKFNVISINLLILPCESLNLIGYNLLLVDYLLKVKIVARVIVYVTLFQTSINTHGANGAPILNLMKHNETVLLYTLLDIFFFYAM